MPSPRPFIIIHHGGIAGFRALEAEWLALAETSARSFLHHPAWYGAKLLADEPEPDAVLFLAFRREGRLFAVVPLRRIAKSLTRFGLEFNYRAWELYYPSEMGLCDGMLAKDVPSTDFAIALIEELKRLGGWDLLEFLHLPQSSLLLPLLARSPGFFSKPSHVSKYLEVSGDYEGWMGRYNKKFRRNLRRKLSNLQGMGQVRFEFVTDPDALERAFTDFLRVEDSGWKGRDGTSLLRQPRMLESYRYLVERGAAGACPVAIHLLWLGDRCIGGQFALLAGTTLYLLKIGYDEAFSAESPGFLLVDQAIKEACQRPGIDRISFVTGTQWMDVWEPWEEPVFNAYYFNLTLKGLALSFAMRLYERIKPFLQSHGTRLKP